VTAPFERVFEMSEDKLVAKLDTYDHRLAGCTTSEYSLIELRKVCGCDNLKFNLEHHMSLAEASEARKARLIALRKRKAGETVDGYVLIYSGWHLVV
jgi:hypothetical protein